MILYSHHPNNHRYLQDDRIKNRRSISYQIDCSVLEFSNLLTYGENNVFDFGGFLDNRIINVAKFVDCCVVPFFYQSKADLVPTIQTVIELEN